MSARPSEQAFPSPHQQIVFSECVRRIEEAQARCDRLDSALREAMESWSFAIRQSIAGVAWGWSCRGGDISDRGW
jgi:hypothetical protein